MSYGSNFYRSAFIEMVIEAMSVIIKRILISNHVRFSCRQEAANRIPLNLMISMNLLISMSLPPGDCCKGKRFNANLQLQMFAIPVELWNCQVCSSVCLNRLKKRFLSKN